MAAVHRFGIYRGGSAWGAVWPIGLLYIIIFGEVNRHAAGTAKFIEQGPLEYGPIQSAEGYFGLFECVRYPVSIWRFGDTKNEQQTEERATNRGSDLSITISDTMKTRVHKFFSKLHMFRGVHLSERITTSGPPINPNRTSKPEKSESNETHTYWIQSYQRLGASSPGSRLCQQHPHRESAGYADCSGL